MTVERHQSRWLVLIASLLLAAGCASIIKGGTQRVVVRSTPQEADVRVVDARNDVIVASGKTPFSARIDRGAGFFKGGKYKVVVEKPGFTPMEFEISASANGWYVAGNLFIGGLIGWIVVDPATGAMWSLVPDESNVRLAPASPKPAPSAEPMISILTSDTMSTDERGAMKPMPRRALSR